MRKSKKITLSIGAVAAIAIPATIIIAETKQNKKESTEFINKSNFSQGYDLYSNSKHVPLIETARFKLKNIDKRPMSEGSIKKIGGTIYVNTTKEGLKILNTKTGKLVDLKGGKTVSVGEGFIEEINGKIYVGTHKDGLKILDTKIGTLVDLKGGKTVNVDDGFIKEINGTTYVGTTNDGLKILDTKVGKLIDLKGGKTVGVASGFIRKIDGTIFVGTMRDGLKILDTKIGTLVDLKGGETVSVNGGFVEEIDGTIYVGTLTEGLKKLNIKTGKLVDLKGGKIVGASSTRFIKKTHGEIYVGGHYLKILDTKTEKLVKFNGAINTYHGFMEEIDGVIYLGTWNEGLNRVDFVADSLQQENKSKIDEALAKAKVKNQGARTVKEVAAAIHDADSLLKETGVDVEALNLAPGTVISKISATADTDGNLTINVEEKTKGALHNLSTSSKSIKGLSDAEIKEYKNKASKKKKATLIGALLGTIILGLITLLSSILIIKKIKKNKAQKNKD